MLILNFCQFHPRIIQKSESEFTGVRMHNVGEPKEESISFTTKELVKPSFTEHIIHAEIHKNPLNQSNNTTSPLSPKPSNTEFND